MKFLKKPINKTNILLIAIFAFAVLMRFYNFNQRVVYGPEQAISLITAAENLQKPSLLGMPYLLRQTNEDLRLFHSPLFVYTLIPFVILFHFNIFSITGVFALVNLLTGLLVFIFAKKVFGRTVAIFSTMLFLFSDYMIYHSLFIWISNYMPLVGILTFYLLYKFIKNRTCRSCMFLLGLVSGIGFGIQYLYLFGILAVLIVVIRFSKHRFTDFLMFSAGGMLGEFPTVLFDVKHNFYHLKTLFAYFLDTLKSPGQSQISYYHFLVLWPITAIFLAVILSKLFKNHKTSAILILITYILLNLLSSKVSFKHAVGMPPGLSAQNVLDAAKAVNQDNPKNFNASVLMDFDNRGYVLRYPLEFTYKRTVLPVEDYPNAGSLYVLSGKSYNFDKPEIWEVSSFLPYKVSFLQDVNDKYAVFKLTK